MNTRQRKTILMGLMQVQVVYSSSPSLQKRNRVRRVTKPSLQKILRFTFRLLQVKSWDYRKIILRSFVD